MHVFSTTTICSVLGIGNLYENFAIDSEQPFFLGYNTLRLEP